MANRLTMAEIDKILTLHTTAHTNREIADLLAINRETVQFAFVGPVDDLATNAWQASNDMQPASVFPGL